MKVSIKLLKGIKLFALALLSFVVVLFLAGVGYSLYRFVKETNLANPDVSSILISDGVLRPGAPLSENGSTKYTLQGYLVEAKENGNNYSIKIKTPENYLYPKVDKYFVDTKELEISLPSKMIKAQTEADLSEKRIKNGDLVLVQWEYLPTKNPFSFKDYSVCLLRNGVESLFAKEKSTCYISQSMKSWSVVGMGLSSQDLLRWYDGLNKQDVITNLGNMYKDGTYFAIDERYYDNGSSTLVQRLMQYSDSADIFSGVLGYSTLYGKEGWNIPALLSEKLLANDRQLTENSVMGCRLGYESIKALETCADCQAIKEKIFSHCEANLNATLASFDEKYAGLVKRDSNIFDNTRGSFGDGNNIDYSILNLPSEFIYYTKLVDLLGIKTPQLNISALGKFAEDYYRKTLEIYDSAINADMVLPTCYILNSSVEMYKETKNKEYLDSATIIYQSYPYQLYCDGRESNDSTFCSKPVYHKLACVEAMYNYASVINDVPEIQNNAKTLLAQIMYRYYSGSPRSYKINSYHGDGGYFVNVVNNILQDADVEQNVRISTSTLLDSGYAIYILNKY